MTVTDKSKQPQAEISIRLYLDQEKLPEKMEWRATDAPFEGYKECKAFLLSIFDPEDRNTLRVDIWNKDMRLDEMYQFFYQTLLSMADTFERATNHQEAAGELREFGTSFGKKLGIVR